MSDWHIAIDGVSTGPLTEEEVKNQIRIGAIHKGYLAWQKGMRTWEPIEAHFDGVTVGKKVGPYVVSEKTRDESISSTNENSSALAANSIPPVNRRSFPVVLLLTLVAVIASFIWLFFNVEQFSDLQSLTTALCFNAILIVIVSAFWVYRTWQFANALLQINQVSSPISVIKFACLLWSVIVLLFAVTFIALEPRWHRIAEVRRAFNKYSVDIDVVSKSISITGLIGPNLSKRLSDLLEVHTGISTIIISSPGGLVDEGLAAARILQSHGGISTIARGQCNSACLLVFMGGMTRYADWKLQFGFHASSPITSLTPLEYDTVAKLGKDSDDYLIARGIPRKFIVAAEEKGPENLEMVPAVRLADAKVLSGLLDGNQLVSTEIAKWRMVEESLIPNNDDDVTIVPVLKAIRETRNSLVADRSGVLFTAFSANDFPLELSILGDIISSTKALAMFSADVEAFHNYLSSSLQQLSFLASAGEWKACVAHANGQPMADTKVLSKNASKAEMESIEKLIRSAARWKWQQRIVPQWASTRGENVVRMAALEFTQNGGDLTKVEKDDKVGCLWNLALTRAVINEGPTRGTAIAQWLYAESQKR